MEYSEAKLIKTKLKTQNESGWLLEYGSKNPCLYVKENNEKQNGIFSSSIGHIFKEVFLPQGFPDSVHPDYIPYQIWDTVQAITSTILGTLTTHSIMKGVGVGESTATPLAAAITWILKDSTGMIGRIIFTWWNGPGLDAQCKQWRLFADIVNDIAMGLELTLPYFPSYSTTILCLASALKPLVGVAGGATRTAITQHQALKNNLADISAKDGSQETCVNLIGSLLGVHYLYHCNASSHVALYYVILVAIHLFANYKAVRSLYFDTLNEDRFAILVYEYLLGSTILNPEQINQKESVLIFRRETKKLCGFDIVIGQSLDKLPKHEGNLMAIDKIQKCNFPSTKNEPTENSGLIFSDIKNRKMYIALCDKARPIDIINAYVEAFIRASYLSMEFSLEPNVIRDAKRTFGPLSMLFKLHKKLSYEEGEKEAEKTSIDEFIRKELGKSAKLLENSDWKLEINLLSIGPYRLHTDSIIVYE